MREFEGKNATVEYDKNRKKGSQGTKPIHNAVGTRVRKYKQLLAAYRGTPANGSKDEPDCPDDLPV